MCEEWRQIPGYSNHYLISSLGRVKSFKYKTVRFLKPFPDKNGYLRVVLSMKNKKKTYSTHYLVCLAFIGPRKKGMQVRHLDGSTNNNNVNNLCYGTSMENYLDRKEHGTWPIGSTNGNSVLTETDVKSIRIMLKNIEDISIREISKLFNVNKGTIHDIKKQRKWNHVEI